LKKQLADAQVIVSHMIVRFVYITCVSFQNTLKEEKATFATLATNMEVFVPPQSEKVFIRFRRKIILLVSIVVVVSFQVLFKSFDPLVKPAAF